MHKKTLQSNKEIPDIQMCWKISTEQVQEILILKNMYV